MKQLKRPRLSLILCFVSCALAILCILTVAVFLTRVVGLYAEKCPT